MEIEQLPPEKPKFLLILILFGVTIIVIFIIAIIVLHAGGRHLVPQTHAQHALLRLHSALREA